MNSELEDGRVPTAPGFPLFASAKPLGVVPTFTAPKPGVFARTFADANFGDAVLIADGAKLARLPAVHPTVHHRINRLDMLWTAAGGIVACVVDMLSRRPLKRFVDEAMNPPQLSSHLHKSVSVAVFGCGPNPAFAVNADSMI